MITVFYFALQQMSLSMARTFLTGLQTYQSHNNTAREFNLLVFVNFLFSHINLPRLKYGAVPEGDLIVVSVECGELHLVLTGTARTLVH
jgi:hypothetical protein